ncbi:MAG: Rieske 2Fe-2S domain-containing protein [Burkholderiales bacterium]
MVGRERLICASNEVLERGKGVRFVLERNGNPVPGFAIRYRGKVHAYVNRCAHVSVELDWAEGEFFDIAGLYLVCATHGAAYYPESGRCAGGPCAGIGLKPIEITERDGNVYLIEYKEN